MSTNAEATTGDTMARDWESSFEQWAKSPSKTEQDRCDNAVELVRNAIDAHWKLGPLLRSSDIRVFVQGSYRNRVNVRQDSDVDMGVLYTGSQFPFYPKGMSGETVGAKPAEYGFSDYKNHIEEALRDYIQKRGSVKRGNKSIKISETSYHVEADVVPFVLYRRYTDPDGSSYCGVALRPDNGVPLVVANFPEQLFPHWLEQHYEEGNKKNEATNRSYRGVVRCLKKMRIEMDDAGIQAVKGVPGYLLECLAYRAPNSCYGHSTWEENVRAVITDVWSNTRSDDDACKEWKEVDGFKILFHPWQKWTRAQAHAVIDAMWDYVGVKT